MDKYGFLLYLNFHKPILAEGRSINIKKLLDAHASTEHILPRNKGNKQIPPSVRNDLTRRDP